MSNQINLVPKDLRDKETKAKEKVKQAMGLPKFKMHAPEAVAGKVEMANEKTTTKQDIEFGSDVKVAEIPKGKFKVTKSKPIAKTKTLPQNKKNDYLTRVKKDFYRHVRTVLIILLAFIVLLAVIFQVVNYYRLQNVQKLDLVNADIQKLNTQIQVLAEEKNNAKINIDNAKLLALLFGENFDWGQFFYNFENLNFDQAQLLNIKANNDGSADLNLKAENVGVLNEFIENLKILEFVEQVNYDEQELASLNVDELVESFVVNVK